MRSLVKSSTSCSCAGVLEAEASALSVRQSALSTTTSPLQLLFESSWSGDVAPRRAIGGLRAVLRHIQSLSCCVRGDIALMCAPIEQSSVSSPSPATMSIGGLSEASHPYAVAVGRRPASRSAAPLDHLHIALAARPRVLPGPGLHQGSPAISDQTDPDSSPYPKPRRSRARTSLWHRQPRRPQRSPSAGSSSQRPGRPGYRST